VKAHSGVIFDEDWNAHTLSQHESTAIDMCELPEDVEYVEESDSGDEPLADGQPLQIGKI